MEQAKPNTAKGYSLLDFLPSTQLHLIFYFLQALINGLLLGGFYGMMVPFIVMQLN